MAQVCEITGIRPLTGNKVSHSNIKTKRRQSPNLKEKVFSLPSLKKSIRIKVSTRAIRTIQKHGGLETTLIQSKEADLSGRLQKIKRELHS